MSCRFVSALLLAAAIVFAGCGAARPYQYYQLDVPGDSNTAADPNAYQVTLLVGRLAASHLYREDHLVWSTTNERMGTYEYQRWAEPPTEMIQDVLFRALRSSGRFREVTTFRSNARGDYLLQGRLYDFRGVSGNPLIARLAIEYELRDTKSGTTVWFHYYSHDEPVSGRDVPAVVAALDRNVQGIVGQVKAGLDQYFSSHPATPAQ
jgi:ABC-type uncharacterized transport system auxiliary subunit